MGFTLTGRPPQVLGQGACGLVLQAEYRGTPVAVKRAVPPHSRTGTASDKPLSWNSDERVRCLLRHAFESLSRT